MTETSTENTIAWLMDPSLPRDRFAVVHRLVLSLKGKHRIDILPDKIKEEELAAVLQVRKYSLVVLPWHKYFAWSKVDGVYGTLRMTGSTIAGYFAEPVLPYELSEVPNYHRGILIDCLRFNQYELSTIISLLIEPKMRVGIANVLGREATLYRDTWYAFDSAGPGMLDAMLNLPFFHRSPWASRKHTLRLCANLLWSMVFDIGPGKADIINTHASEVERGRIEVGTNGEWLAMRLVYTAPEKTPKDFLSNFWPDMNRGTEVQQILARQSDFIKVHIFPEANRVEIVLFFTKSAPSRTNSTEIRGFWIEPLSDRHIADSDPEGTIVVQINRAGAKTIGPAVPAVSASALDPIILLQQLHDIHFATREYCIQLDQQIKEFEKKNAESPEILMMRHKLMGLRQRQFSWRERYREMLIEIEKIESEDFQKKKIA